MRVFCRAFRLLPILLLAGALAACVPASNVVSSGGRAPDVERSAFQARLDRFGIPLRLPAAGKAILVNVPAFELIAFEDGEPVFRSRIIVGTPWNPTPLIDTYVSRVTFRPSWRPTPSMVASGEYPDRVRPPGPNNPLGLAAVRLEPGLLVYLHDTNQRHLFELEDRALSHGCIRVQRWDELIAWILGRSADWVRRTAETPPTREVAADPIPVLIRYYTAFPGRDGSLETFADIYGRLQNGTVIGSSGAKKPAWCRPLPQ